MDDNTTASGSGAVAGSDGSDGNDSPPPPFKRVRHEPDRPLDGEDRLFWVPPVTLEIMRAAPRHLQFTSVAQLMLMRQHDRFLEGAHGNERALADVVEVYDNLCAAGGYSLSLSSGVQIDYYGRDGTCLVNENNHRLLVLWELGVKYVPAFLHLKGCENTERRKAIPPRALSEPDYNYWGGQQRPEAIGLDVLVWERGSWNERTVRMPRRLSRIFGNRAAEEGMTLSDLSAQKK